MVIPPNCKFGFFWLVSSNLIPSIYDLLDGIGRHEGFKILSFLGFGSIPKVDNTDDFYE